jgi:hypothetical protein
MHTKPLRSSDFMHMAHKILGQPTSPTTTPTTSNLPTKNMSVSEMDVESQPNNERKRLWLPDATRISEGTKWRKEHLDRYVTRTVMDSTTDADVNVSAVQPSCR